MPNLKEITPYEFNESFCKLVGKNWMLITAKDETGKVNTMTAGWGGIGVMWGKNVVFAVIRPQRYTKEFVDIADKFSLSFFDDNFKDKLTYLGRVSGRDENKIEKANLTLNDVDNVPIFNEAKISIVAKKLYVQNYLPECFCDLELMEKWYPNKDYHIMYVAEIEKILTK